jgi:iron only hydrogenase large subunit-like protein
MQNRNPIRPQEKSAVVYTSKAMCRDCYRCVRVCPVNAIKMEGGQAQVIADQCIACGTCIAECPQHAKAYRTDYGKVLAMLEANDDLAVSLAPSFAACYTPWEQKRLPSALRSLGFNYVGETAIGAWHTAEASLQWMQARPGMDHICTACPAVVSYISQYVPEFAPNLVPVVSPMLAHARMLKQKHPKRKVIFAGPCVAKKAEATAGNNEVFIDAVLTFEELDELLKIKQINLQHCEESNFDEEAGTNARLFALEGGLLKTAGLDTDMLQANTIAVSGFDEIREVLNGLAEKKDQQNGHQKWIIEPLFCKHGCINGPSVRHKQSLYSRRNMVLQFAKSKPGATVESTKLFDRLNAHYPPLANKQQLLFSESQIQAVLQLTGKHKAEDELNCMACGFSSCRNKAIAVLQGIAEPEMCMPYMRRLAEKKFDLMIDHDPNGIILLNNTLEIVHMNAAFKKMFSCSDALIGRKISYLIDPDAFEKMATSEETLIRQTMHYSSYNLICHQISYAIPELSQYVGIFVDITDLKINKEKLNEIKTETIIRAQELIEHQISMAQEMARFLGDNTARGEVLMNKLIDSIKK